MEDKPSHPWRFDTNERYREVVRLIISLSTASLLLPIFLAREFLSLPEATALKDVFTCAVYWSWGLLAASILLGIIFHYLSAKWSRLAWGKPARVLGCDVSEKKVEAMLDATFWGCVVGFICGVGAIMIFLRNYVPNS